MKIKSEYSFNVCFKVGVREGSGMVLTTDDIINIFNRAGYYAKIGDESSEKEAHILVCPPRHLVTGEDIKLQLEEAKNESS